MASYDWQGSFTSGCINDAHPVYWQTLDHLHALRPSLLYLLAQGRARQWPSTCVQAVTMYQERQADSHIKPITSA